MKNYSYQKGAAKHGLSHAKSLPISAKDAREVMHNIQGKPVARAEVILAGVISQEKPIKFTRHNTEVGHKPGIGPGRYPVNAAREILRVLQNAKANAKAKGMDEASLVIATAVANRSFYKRPGGSRVFSKGPSHRSRSASVEIALEERRRK